MCTRFGQVHFSGTASTYLHWILLHVWYQHCSRLCRHFWQPASQIMHTMQQCGPLLLLTAGEAGCLAVSTCKWAGGMRCHAMAATCMHAHAAADAHAVSCCCSQPAKPAVWQPVALARGLAACAATPWQQHACMRMQ